MWIVVLDFRHYGMFSNGDDSVRDVMTVLHQSAVALLGLFLIGSGLSSADDRWATATELAEMAEPRLFSLLPDPAELPQDSRWGYLHALGHMARGEMDQAAQLCGESHQAESIPSFLLGQFLAMHTQGKRALRSPPAPWQGNPSLWRCQQVARWTGSNLSKELREFLGIMKVQHYGPWPLPIRDPGRFGNPEPEHPEERLKWLNQGRNSLLTRLTGVGSSRKSPRWLLVSLLRPEDVPRFAVWTQRFGTLFTEQHQILGGAGKASDALAILWVVTVPPGDDGGWSREIQQMPLPLFVAVTQIPRTLQQFGLERGGVSLLMNPQKELRMVADRWLPLPVLAPFVARNLTP